MDDIEHAIAQRRPDHDERSNSGTVVEINGGRVREDGGCFEERHSVLLLVRRGFRIVPLEVALDHGSHPIQSMGCIPYRINPSGYVPRVVR